MKTRVSLKYPVTDCGIIYGSCIRHEKYVDGCPPFRPFLSALQAPTYKLVNYLVPILEPLTNNKYTVKDLLTLPLKLLNRIQQLHGKLRY